MKALPLARQSSLIVKEVDGETLVYDLESDEAHCLNSTAAQVWKNCDGHSSVDEIANRIGKTVNTTVDENVVWLALDQLEKFKLLDAPVEKPHVFAGGISRRQAVRVLGAAAVALPVITSIIVPTVAQAQSVVACGCLSPPDCAPFGAGLCCTPHNACTTFPSTKGCIASPPPCK